MMAGFNVPCDHCGERDEETQVMACDIFDPDSYEPLTVRLCPVCRREMRLRLHDFWRRIPPIPGTERKTSAQKKARFMVRARRVA